MLEQTGVANAVTGYFTASEVAMRGASVFMTEGGHTLSTVMFVPLSNLEFLHTFTAYSAIIQITIIQTFQIGR